MAQFIAATGGGVRDVRVGDEGSGWMPPEVHAETVLKATCFSCVYFTDEDDQPYWRSVGIRTLHYSPPRRSSGFGPDEPDLPLFLPSVLVSRARCSRMTSRS